MRYLFIALIVSGGAIAAGCASVAQNDAAASSVAAQAPDTAQDGDADAPPAPPEPPPPPPPPPPPVMAPGAPPPISTEPLQGGGERIGQGGTTPD